MSADEWNLALLMVLLLGFYSILFDQDPRRGFRVFLGACAFGWLAQWPLGPDLNRYTPNITRYAGHVSWAAIITWGAGLTAVDAMHLSVARATGTPPTLWGYLASGVPILVILECVGSNVIRMKLHGYQRFESLMPWLNSMNAPPWLYAYYVGMAVVFFYLVRGVGGIRVPETEPASLLPLRRSLARLRSLPALAAALAIGGLLLTGAGTASPRPGTHADLTRLFAEWREFQHPRLVDGVPDYRAEAMARQRTELATWRDRLRGIDVRGWPIPHQVDWHLVQAEMNGLDFDHRVLRPWANNPAFYVTVFPDQSDQPAREGPLAYGAVELWSYRFPLSAADAATVSAGIRAIPGLMAQAKGNLVGNGHDLWVYGATSLRQQAADLEELSARVAGYPELKGDVLRAKKATDDLAAWVEAQAASKTGPSGVGVENYDWYLKHVHLAPYTWHDEVRMLERELGRARTFLALEERRNRDLPAQAVISSAEEHDRRMGAAVTEYMDFLSRRDLLTIRDGMDAALRARLGRFRPGPLEFFSEVDYRDPIVMRTHGFHWFDLLHMTAVPHPSPIRRVPLLYNLFDTRTEGLATGWEEMMLQAGMLDARPRSRELVYILLAQRAARGLGDLRMHAAQQTLEEAAAFASANTPRGWLRLDGAMVRGEQHLYLQQPAYGTSYLVGKMQIEQLIGERRRQVGERFTFRGFMDEFEAAGLIPMSMIEWELTGARPAFLADPR